MLNCCSDWVPFRSRSFDSCLAKARRMKQMFSTEPWRCNNDQPWEKETSHINKDGYNWWHGWKIPQAAETGGAGEWGTIMKGQIPARCVPPANESRSWCQKILPVGGQSWTERQHRHTNHCCTGGGSEYKINRDQDLHQPGLQMLPEPSST